ncbi:hypothetical protein AGMMS49545_04800 [Betaproteobacteria bacterium]|nr:hypothetical protein AGMMS49545_04800 [Betaproteobacteria bacterium]GHU41139.1 hypothetical protein AGMMS50289_03800 [Betaproteobacteria bacterium]
MTHGVQELYATHFVANQRHHVPQGETHMHGEPPSRLPATLPDIDLELAAFVEEEVSIPAPS